jgi:hypothetical protein
MYERHHQPLVPRRVFIRRLARNIAFSVLLLGGSLVLGVLGYHLTEGISWIDSLLNASMLLGGMGPVTELHTTAGKLFASFFALYSGIVFLIGAGLIFAPVFHRLLHHFHLEIEDERSSRRQ